MLDRIERGSSLAAAWRAAPARAAVEGRAWAGLSTVRCRLRQQLRACIDRNDYLFKHLKAN